MPDALKHDPTERDHQPVAVDPEHTEMVQNQKQDIKEEAKEQTQKDLEAVENTDKGRYTYTKTA